MKLETLILAVKEQKLDKDQLENYHTQISHLFVEMQMEMANLEKEEALFMNAKHPDDSAIARKIQWKATESGQRLIVLKRYQLATKELLNSLKSRIYQLL